LYSSKVRVRRGTGCSNASVKDERYDSEEEVDVEEGCDLFAAWRELAGVVHSLFDECDIPTAVNLERTWIIMTTVIIRARICMKSFAAWKMSVFAISIVLE
jgi:hypothetical protein